MARVSHIIKLID